MATEGQGIPELAGLIARHAAHLHASRSWEQREAARLQSDLDERLRQALVARWRSNLPEAHYQAVLQLLVQRKISPWQAVQQLLNGGEI